MWSLRGCAALETALPLKGRRILPGTAPGIPEISYEPRLRDTIFGALREELSYFALCVIQNCKPAVVTPQEGVEAVRTAVALIESGRTGRDVTIA
jgi:hypothetical protein